MKSRINPLVNERNGENAQYEVITFCHAAFFSASVFSDLYNGSVMIARIV
jgi:hypothetical protein